MAEPEMNLIKFLETLGVNPQTVRSDIPVQIQFNSTQTVIQFGTALRVPPELVSQAIIAATQSEDPYTPYSDVVEDVEVE